jgi:hypothetical protein
MDKPTRGAGLAARFRQAVESEAEAKRRLESERQKAILVAVQAVDALLAELEAFGKELGFLDVRRTPNGLRLAHGERLLFLLRGDPGEVVGGSVDKVEEAIYRVYREPALDHKWVLAFNHRRQEVRLPLFDQGLEELLVSGLGLPRPG